MRSIVIMLLLLIGSPALASETDCIARAVYHEARGEPVLCQEMIADVVINRMQHPRFPDTACKVVYQRRQFSWTSKNPDINERDAWASSRKLAIKKYKQHLTKTRVDKSQNSVFFTQGRRFGQVVAKCGNHIFMEL